MPKEADIWLWNNCKLEFVRDRLKEQTEAGKKSLLDALNKRFFFHKDGTITERE